MVQCAVLVFQQINLEMLPTPKKCFYTFSPRDLAKVF